MTSQAHRRFIPASIPRTGLLFLALVSVLLAACTAAPEGITVGADAPEFTLRDATGREVSLADYEGTPVLLFFHMALG